MENNYIKIRINLNNREFEVDGDANYINEVFGNTLKEYLQIIKGSTNTTEAPISDIQHKKENHTANSETRVSILPDSFGEYFNKFPRTLGNVDKLLIASYFVQIKNSGNSFTLSEASSLLLEQGVKLSNPNVFNKSNEATKKIFKLAGKNFRVSDSGIQYIKTL